MPSMEAGICRPKLQSAPEIQEGDDKEHILYCPECAARLRLSGVGATTLEATPARLRSDRSRKTLPEWLPEDPSTVPPPIANAGSDAPLLADDDDPTCVLRQSDLPLELQDPTFAAAPMLATSKSARQEESGAKPVLIALDAEDENTPPKGTAPVTSGTTAPELSPLALSATISPALSDAPVAREVTTPAVSRGIPRKPRGLVVGLTAAAAFGVLGGVAYLNHSRAVPVQQVTFAATPASNQAPLAPPTNAPVQAAAEAAVPAPATPDAVAPAPTPALTVAEPAAGERRRVQANPESARNSKPALPVASRRNLTAAAQDSTDSAEVEPTTVAPVKPEPVEPKSELFDAAAATSALDDAARRASSCRKDTDPSGVAVVTIGFAPSGRVTTANLSGPPFVGTATGSCIAATLRTAKIPPFTGDVKTVRKTVTIQ